MIRNILSILFLFQTTCWGLSEVTYTVTEGGAYSTMAAALAQAVIDHPDLVSGDVLINIKIDGAWTNPDTTTVNITGFTTDATRYINIYTTATARHTGTPNTGYTMTPSNATVITVSELYTRITGIEFEAWNTTTNVRDAISIPDAGRYTLVDKCIFHTMSGDGRGVYATWTAYVRNCMFLNFSSANGYCRAILGSYVTAQNCTAVNINSKTTGYSPALSASVITNCICLVTVDADGVAFSGTPTYSISSDTSASGDGCVTEQVIADLDFAGAADLHLTSASTVAIGAGTDLSGTFTDDIDGDTRSDWDIGADEYVAAGGWGHSFMGVANANIAKINGVAIADIKSVNGVE